MTVIRRTTQEDTHPELGQHRLGIERAARQLVGVLDALESVPRYGLSEITAIPDVAKRTQLALMEALDSAHADLRSAIDSPVL